MNPEQQFFFDDFFVSDTDPGLEVKVSSQGREIPIHLKKRFTLEDIESAKEKGVDKTYDLVSGDVKVNKVDEGAFTRELLVRAILSWPFKYQDGRDVPVNEHTVRKMDAEMYTQLTKIVQGMIAQKKTQTDPLGKNSAEV